MLDPGLEHDPNQITTCVLYIAQPVAEMCPPLSVVSLVNTNRHNLPFSALTLLVGRQQGHPACKKAGCWFVGGDDLTELCTTYSSISPVVTTTSIILCFNKHWLTQVHLENDR